jgi:leucine dehydrogenase
VLDQEFEQIEVLQDRAGHCLVFIAIHSTRLGPAFGGIRRWTYATPQDGLADALALARAMTWKSALAGIPGGGGKAVIVQRPELDRRAAYRLIGQFVELMGGRYYTGPDVGTQAADLEEVARHTRFVARPGAGGAGDLAEPTARGVLAAIASVARRLGATRLDGITVALQGLGDVGWRLGELLQRAGARIVAADLQAERCARAREELGAEVVAPSAIVGAECDVFAPCALGGVIDDGAVTALRARAVVGSANNVLAEARCGRALFERGVLYAPDFVVNAGALIHGALFHLEGRAPPPQRIDAIGDVVGEILDRSRAERCPPEVIAERIATERVAAAPAGPYLPRERRKP